MGVRSKGFCMLNNIIGHELIKEKLLSLKSNLPKVLLFNGPKNVGKLFTVTNFIEELYTEKIKDRKCPDIKTYYPTNGTFTIETVQEIISDNEYYPIELDKKFYILKNIDYASPAATQTFLKVLEDSSPLNYFILTTEDLDKVPETLKSRSVIIDFYAQDLSKYYPDLSVLQLKLMKGCVGNHEIIKALDCQAIDASVKGFLKNMKSLPYSDIMEWAAWNTCDYDILLDIFLENGRDIFKTDFVEFVSIVKDFQKKLNKPLALDTHFINFLFQIKGIGDGTKSTGSHNRASLQWKVRRTNTPS